MKKRTPCFSCPEWDDCGLTCCCCGGLVSYLAGMYGVGGLAPRCKANQLTLEVGVCLDLSCLARGPKEPLGLGPVACPALKAT